MTRHVHALVAVALSTSMIYADEEEPNVRLFEWERGFAVQTLESDDMAVYLWFYEWNMFEAIEVTVCIRELANAWNETEGCVEWMTCPMLSCESGAIQGRTT